MPALVENADVKVELAANNAGAADLRQGRRLCVQRRSLADPGLIVLFASKRVPGLSVDPHHFPDNTSFVAGCVVDADGSAT
jgi:hypothetical protein